VRKNHIYFCLWHSCKDVQWIASPALAMTENLVKSTQQQ